MSGYHNSKSNPHSFYSWTVEDEAIHRGMNYADVNMPILLELRKDEGITIHAMLKNAYQEGFLHGFAHKFDNTNYEEKEDGKR